MASKEDESRPAVLGEPLIISPFALHDGRALNGFTSPHEAGSLVCVQSGSKLLLRGVSRVDQKRWGLANSEAEVEFLSEMFPSRTVRYRRDLIVFPNGLKVDLQKVPSGLAADVVALPPTLIQRIRRTIANLGRREMTTIFESSEQKDLLVDSVTERR